MTKQQLEEPIKTIRRSGKTGRGASTFVIAERTDAEWTVRGTPTSSLVLRRVATEHEALLKRLADR